MKQFTFLISIIAVVAVALNVVQCESAKTQALYRDQENERYRIEAERRMQGIKARDGQILALLADREKDSISHAKNQGALKARLNALRARVTGPAILHDTIIVLQDSLIADLENERDTLYISDNRIIDSLQTSIDTLKTMYASEYQRAERFHMERDWEKSKNITLGPSLGIDVLGRPVIGFTATYRVFSFRVGKRK